MDTVAIAGVGLIGGSFALAIRRAGFSGPILGVSSPATIAQALQLGIIDEGVTLEQACARADLIYLAQPIQTIIELLPRLRPLLRPGTLVTDAGSTKVSIVDAARQSLPDGMFLGGHPMAGKEVRGAAAADAALFEKRPYVLTPARAQDMDDPRAAALLELIGAIGARPVVLSPAEHDLAVAYTSHLPQLLATALGSVLSAGKNTGEVAGPAVLDFTRLALSPYDIWHDIFATNPVNIRMAIRDLISKLQYLEGNLTGGDTARLFEEAAEAARALRKTK